MGDTTYDEFCAVGRDVDEVLQLKSKSEGGLFHEWSGNGFLKMRGEAGGFEFRVVAREAGGALVGLLDDGWAKVVDRPATCLDDVGEGMPIDHIGTGDHAKEGWI